MMARSGSRSRQGGFTLLEMMVALTILGMMTVLIVALLPAGITGAARVSDISEGVGQIRDVQQLLRRQLTTMPPLTRRDVHEDRLLFSGREQVLRFPAYPLSGQGGLAPVLITLRLQARESRTALLYLQGREERELMSNINDGQFSYYGVLSPEVAPRWHRAWTSSERLPQLVRLTLQPADERQFWPALIIAPATQPPPFG